MTAVAPGSTSPEDDEFIPKDIIKAVAVGCSVRGYTDADPYAETMVFVKWTTETPKWDFKPVMSRYTLSQGGVIRAIDDCTEWFQKVKKKIEATKEVSPASKQP